jgi:hypothetical protein
MVRALEEFKKSVPGERVRQLKIRDYSELLLFTDKGRIGRKGHTTDRIPGRIEEVCLALILAKVTEFDRKGAFLRRQVLWISWKGEDSAIKSIGCETQRQVIQVHCLALSLSMHKLIRCINILLS